jgi:AcrR family transcriptional regulator
MNDPSPFRTPTQKEADRAAKREAVLRAAVRMFNERGFHATSLDDVAASLGVSKRTIYHYLANKEQVLLECMNIGLKQLLSAAAEARSHPGSGSHRLIQYLRRYAEINMGEFGRCVIRTGEELLSPDGLAQFRSAKRQIDIELRGLLQDAVDDGSIARIDVKMAAFTLAGALNWPARWHEPNGPMSAEAISQSMVDILTQGLLPRT